MQTLRISLLIFISIPSWAFTVVIDPGHGGIDGGANRGSFVESQIVFQIAEKIEAQLKKNQTFQVSLTRSKNRGISLHDRVQFAVDKKADLFLSLHANSSTSIQVSGMEYYFSSKYMTTFGGKSAPTIFLTEKNKGSAAGDSNTVVETIKKDLAEFGKMKRSLELSQNIQTAWQLRNAENKQISASKIRRAPFYVIENSSMPSVLVEVGFISNQREARKLVSAEYQDELARALTDAIVNFKEKSDK